LYNSVQNYKTSESEWWKVETVVVRVQVDIDDASGILDGLG